MTKTGDHLSAASNYVLVSGASTDGWLPLFDALSDTDMQANALSGSAKIDVGPHVDAYKGAGFDVKPIAKALAEFNKIMRPQIVSSAEFKAAIKAVAGSLLALSLQGSMLFPMENHGIKSNLWVFMSVLREIRSIVKGGDRVWRALAERIFIVMERRSPDQPSASLPKGPVHLIFSDDCVYSGWQMGDIVGQFCDMEFNGKKTEHPIICPAYATIFGLTVCLEGLASQFASTLLEPMLIVPRTIAYPENAARRLYKQDVAFCFQYHSGGGISKSKPPPPRGWVVMTLFQIMGIMEHNIMTVADHESYSKYHNSVYNDTDGQKETLDHIVVRSTSIGKAAVVFAHKVADQVSVPTVAFLLGPTLQRALSKLCPSMVCPNEKIDVVSLPWPKLLKAMDFDPTGRTSAQPFWDQQVTARMRHMRCSDALIKSLGKAPIVINMKDMKHYVPLLSPDKVCGVKFSYARTLAEQGDWTAFSPAEDVTYDGTCIRSPHKAKLRKKIDELVATKGSCTTLATALGLLNSAIR